MTLEKFAIKQEEQLKSIKEEADELLLDLTLKGDDLEKNFNENVT